MKSSALARRLLATLTACVMITALITACSSDTTDPVIVVTGTYMLTTISGTALPVHITDTVDGKLFIDAGSLVLGTDGSFTLTETDRVVGDKATTTTLITSTGTYSTSSGNITLHYTAPVRTVNGTVKADAVTLTGGGLSFVYRK